MYPSRFQYAAPRSLAEALDLLGAHDESKVVAGGQSLVPMLKLRFASPDMLVDINRLPGLDYHRIEADGSLHIGALCRHADLEHSTTLRQPTMVAVAPLIADPLVRNRGTLVGSLCHADPQGDWACAMIALDGSVVAQGPRGRRVIPVRDFVTGPFQNVLAHDEIAVEAIVPAPKGDVAGGYLKLERRVGDFATAAVGVSIELIGGRVLRAGIGLAGVGGATLEARDAQQVLTGAELTADVIARAADLTAQIAQPRTDHRGSADYKKHVVRTFTSRLLTKISHDIDRAA